MTYRVLQPLLRRSHPRHGSRCLSIRDSQTKWHAFMALDLDLFSSPLNCQALVSSVFMFYQSKHLTDIINVHTYQCISISESVTYGGG